MEFIFDLGYSPKNDLFEGVAATKAPDGRWNLPMNQEMVATVKQNAKRLAHNTGAQKAVLTGGAPVWLYAAITHAIGNMFQEVVTRDVQGNELVIASKI